MFSPEQLGQFQPILDMYVGVKGIQISPKEGQHIFN